MTWLLVCLGAAVGAPLRYLVDRAIQSRHSSAFPWGTLTVNVVGSFLLGLAFGADAPAAVVAGVGTGFCGAFTTFSTFGYETLRLTETGDRRLAGLNVVLSVVAGVAAAAGGYALGTAS